MGRVRRALAPLLRIGADEVRVGSTAKAELKQRLTRRTRILIDAAKGTNYRFTRYGRNGNSPHQRGSEIFLRTGDIRAVEAFLSEFIASFRPNNLAELLFGAPAPELAPLNELPPLAKFQPWMEGVAETRGFVGQRDASFRAISTEHVRAEAAKQVAALTSLRDNGYLPEVHRRGFLRGRLLLAGGDYRFIVEDGKHRLGALNALGAGEIAVRLAEGGPAVVDEEEVDRWPLVRDGRCSRRLALRLLHRHFE